MADIFVKRTGRRFYKIDSELAQVLIEAGLADSLKPTQPSAPQYPPKGWRVESMLATGKDQTGALESIPSITKYVIVWHSGMGEKRVYASPPGPSRVWSGEKQDYVLKESDCPSEVIEHWKAVSGLPSESERKARVAEAKQRREIEAFREVQRHTAFGLQNDPR